MGLFKSAALIFSSENWIEYKFSSEFQTILA